MLLLCKMILVKHPCMSFAQYLTSLMLQLVQPEHIFPSRKGEAGPSWRTMKEGRLLIFFVWEALTFWFFWGMSLLEVWWCSGMIVWVSNSFGRTPIRLKVTLTESRIRNGSLNCILDLSTSKVGNHRPHYGDIVGIISVCNEEYSSLLTETIYKLGSQISLQPIHLPQAGIQEHFTWRNGSQWEASSSSIHHHPYFDCTYLAMVEELGDTKLCHHQF